MTPARTRTVDSERNRELVIEEYAKEGYQVVEADGRTTTLRRRDHGSLWAHLAILLFLGWWTLGVANLVYAVYRRIASAEGVIVRVDETGGDDA